MLSKIRTACRLSGQFWIKDLPGRSRICVLELDGALVFVWCLLMPIGQALDYFLPSRAKLNIPLEFSFDFRGHSEASDVFARTFQCYPKSGGVSSGNRSFLRFPATFDRFGAASRGSRNNPVRNSATIANNRTPDTGRGALSSWTS